MNPVGFAAAALSGFVISLVGSGFFALGFSTLLIPLLAALYLLWLLISHRQHRGASLVFVGWVILAAAIYGLGLNLMTSIFSCVLLAWIVRSVMRYRRLHGIAADAALSVAAIGVALSVAGYSHSVFLSIWSYFLVQALVFLMPEQKQRNGKRSNHDNSSMERFEKARASAQAALQQINSVH